MSRVNIALLSILSICLLATLISALAGYGACVMPYRGHMQSLSIVTSILAIIFLPRSRWFPQLPLFIYILLAVLIGFQSFMVINSLAEVKAFLFTEFEDRVFPYAPGTVSKKASTAGLIELCVASLAVIAAARARESKAWIYLLIAISLLGASTSLIGLGHKVLDIPTIWGGPDRPPETFFAPFFYNANAAALMNLCLPISLGLGLYFSSKKSALTPVFFIAAAITLLGTIAAASKGAILILGLILFLFICLEWKFIKNFKSVLSFKNGLNLEKKIALIIGALTSLFLVGLFMSKSLGRFQDLKNSLLSGQSDSVHGRLAMMEKMIEMSSPENGGWHGFGAGTFPHLAPWFNYDNNPLLYGRWMQGHSDPLQTIAEWGWLGAVLWFIFGIGAVLVGFIKRTSQGKEGHLINGILISLVGVGLHSCFDFPLTIFSIHLIAMSLCGILWSLLKSTHSSSLS